MIRSQLKQAQTTVFETRIKNVGDVKQRYINGIFIFRLLLDSIHAETIILAPLTNSLYVPCYLSDAENVIIDVGTGITRRRYYVRYLML
jgi:hypothetical protein